MGHVGTFGKHSSATSSLHWNAENSLLVSGGWDGYVKCWDVRQGQSEPSSSVKISERVYSMSASASKVVVIVNDKKLLIFDTRNFTIPAEVKDSPLKNQTRSVVCFPDSSGYAIGSIEVKPQCYSHFGMK
jgi:WD40 repeat protein